MSKDAEIKAMLSDEQLDEYVILKIRLEAISRIWEECRNEFRVFAEKNANKEAMPGEYEIIAQKRSEVFEIREEIQSQLNQLEEEFQEKFGTIPSLEEIRRVSLGWVARYVHDRSFMEPEEKAILDSNFEAKYGFIPSEQEIEAVIPDDLVIAYARQRNFLKNTIPSEKNSEMLEAIQLQIVEMENSFLQEYGIVPSEKRIESIIPDGVVRDYALLKVEYKQLGDIDALQAMNQRISEEYGIIPSKERIGQVIDIEKEMESLQKASEEKQQMKDNLVQRLFENKNFFITDNQQFLIAVMEETQGEPIKPRERKGLFDNYFPKHLIHERHNQGKSEVFHTTPIRWLSFGGNEESQQAVAAFHNGLVRLLPSQEKQEQYAKVLVQLSLGNALPLNNFLEQNPVVSNYLQNNLHRLEPVMAKWNSYEQDQLGIYQERQRKQAEKEEVRGQKSEREFELNKGIWEEGFKQEVSHYNNLQPDVLDRVAEQVSSRIMDYFTQESNYVRTGEGNSFLRDVSQKIIPFIGDLQKNYDYPEAFQRAVRENAISNLVADIARHITTDRDSNRSILDGNGKLVKGWENRLQDVISQTEQRTLSNSKQIALDMRSRLAPVTVDQILDSLTYKGMQVVSEEQKGAIKRALAIGITIERNGLFSKYYDKDIEVSTDDVGKMQVIRHQSQEVTLGGVNKQRITPDILTSIITQKVPLLGGRPELVFEQIQQAQRGEKPVIKPKVKEEEVQHNPEPVVEDKVQPEPVKEQPVVEQEVAGVKKNIPLEPLKTKDAPEISKPVVQDISKEKPKQPENTIPDGTAIRNTKAYNQRWSDYLNSEVVQKILVDEFETSIRAFKNTGQDRPIISQECVKRIVEEFYKQPENSEYKLKEGFEVFKEKQVQALAGAVKAVVQTAISPDTVSEEERVRRGVGVGFDVPDELIPVSRVMGNKAFMPRIGDKSREIAKNVVGKLPSFDPRIINVSSVYSNEGILLSDIQKINEGVIPTSLYDMQEYELKSAMEAVFAGDDVIRSMSGTQLYYELQKNIPGIELIDPEAMGRLIATVFDKPVDSLDKALHNNTFIDGVLGEVEQRVNALEAYYSNRNVCFVFSGYLEQEQAALSTIREGLSNMRAQEEERRKGQLNEEYLNELEEVLSRNIQQPLLVQKEEQKEIPLEQLAREIVNNAIGHIRENGQTTESKYTNVVSGVKEWLRGQKDVGLLEETFLSKTFGEIYTTGAASWNNNKTLHQALVERIGGELSDSGLFSKGGLFQGRNHVKINEGLLDQALQGIDSEVFSDIRRANESLKTDVIMEMQNLNQSSDKGNSGEYQGVDRRVLKGLREQLSTMSPEEILKVREEIQQSKKGLSGISSTGEGQQKEISVDSIIERSNKSFRMDR